MLAGMKRELTKFPEGFLTHQIKCPSCRKTTNVMFEKTILNMEGMIKCKCGITFVYEIETSYTIVTATVNEFKNNQL